MGAGHAHSGLPWAPPGPVLATEQAPGREEAQREQVSLQGLQATWGGGAGSWAGRGLQSEPWS